MHNFEVHSNESACRNSGRLGLDQVIYEDNPWLGILETAAFVICSTKNRLTGHSPGQLVFGRDMIPPIKHTAVWN